MLRGQRPCRQVLADSGDPRGFSRHIHPRQASLVVDCRCSVMDFWKWKFRLRNGFCKNVSLSACAPLILKTPLGFLWGAMLPPVPVHLTWAHVTHPSDAGDPMTHVHPISESHFLGHRDWFRDEHVTQVPPIRANMDPSALALG